MQEQGHGGVGLQVLSVPGGTQFDVAFSGELHRDDNLPQRMRVESGTELAFCVCLFESDILPTQVLRVHTVYT